MGTVQPIEGREVFFGLRGEIDESACQARAPKDRAKGKQEGKGKDKDMAKGKQEGKGKDKHDQKDPLEVEREVENKMQAREEFFSELPEDRLSPPEINLRRSLLAFL